MGCYIPDGLGMILSLEAGILMESLLTGGDLGLELSLPLLLLVVFLYYECFLDDLLPPPFAIFF